MVETLQIAEIGVMDLRDCLADVENGRMTPLEARARVKGLVDMMQSAIHVIETTAQEDREYRAHHPEDEEEEEEEEEDEEEDKGEDMTVGECLEILDGITKIFEEHKK